MMAGRHVYDVPVPRRYEKIVIAVRVMPVEVRREAVIAVWATWSWLASAALNGRRQVLDGSCPSAYL